MKNKIISILLTSIEPLTIAQIGNRLNFEIKQSELFYLMDQLVSSGIVNVTYIDISKNKKVGLYSI